MSYTIGIDARKAQDFGIGTYVRNLVQALAGLDRENRYVLFARPQDQELFQDLPETFRVVVESAPVYSLRELAALSLQIVKQRLDLYHATHYVLPWLLPSKVVVTIHDIIHLLYPDFLPNRFAFLYAQRMIGRSLSRGDRIITVSGNTRADLLRYFDVDNRKLEVIYNGVEDLYRRRVGPEELEHWQLALGITPPYLLFVGNPKPHKNLDTVVKAYARARRQAGFTAPLVCVGNRAANEFKIRQRAESLGVGSHVRLLGHVPQEALPAIYQGATLFLYPTLYEGFGLPIVEAMASGLPVITSNTSALKEIGQGYALLVEPLDVGGMADAIARAMTDAELRHDLAERGLRRAEDFRWQEAAAKTLSIYRSLLPPAARDPATMSGDGESR